MSARKPESPVSAIPPYRMAQLLEVSSKLVKTLVTNVWALSYEEILIVLDIMHVAVERSRDEGR